MRLIDAKIIDKGPRAVCILMELGEMDFGTYLQLPAPVPVPEPEGTTILPSHRHQGFNAGENSR